MVPFRHQSCEEAVGVGVAVRLADEERGRLCCKCHLGTGASLRILPQHFNLTGTGEAKAQGYVVALIDRAGEGHQAPASVSRKYRVAGRVEDLVVQVESRSRIGPGAPVPGNAHLIPVACVGESVEEVAGTGAQGRVGLLDRRDVVFEGCEVLGEGYSQLLVVVRVRGAMAVPPERRGSQGRGRRARLRLGLGR